MSEKYTIVEQYLKNISDLLNSVNKEDDTIDGLRNELYDYADNHPDYTMQDLIDVFGTSEKVANNILESQGNIDSKKIVKKKKRKKKLIYILIAVLLIAAISGAAYIFYLNTIGLGGYTTQVLVIED